MARINIEERWWNDPRRRVLRNLLVGREATEQVTVNAWKIAGDYWCERKGCSLIPGAVFIYMDGYKELIQSGLAIAYELRLVDPIKFRQEDSTENPRPIHDILSTPNRLQDVYFYLPGTRDSVIDLMRERAKKSLGGQKSADRPRDKLGRLLKQSPETPRSVQDTSSSSKCSSSSSSSSSSFKKEEEKKKKEKEIPKLIEGPKRELAVASETGVSNSQTLPAKAKKEKFTELTRKKMNSFIRTYCECYAKKNKGSKPDGIRMPQILNQIGLWVEGVSEDRIINLIEVYFQIDDFRPFEESCHGVQQFFWHLNRIGIALDTGTAAGATDWSAIFNEVRA